MIELERDIRNYQERIASLEKELSASPQGSYTYTRLVERIHSLRGSLWDMQYSYHMLHDRSIPLQTSYQMSSTI